MLHLFQIQTTQREQRAVLSHVKSLGCLFLDLQLRLTKRLHPLPETVDRKSSCHQKSKRDTIGTAQAGLDGKINNPVARGNQPKPQIRRTTKAQTAPVSQRRNTTLPPMPGKAIRLGPNKGLSHKYRSYCHNHALIWCFQTGSQKR